MAADKPLTELQVFHKALARDVVVNAHRADEWFVTKYKSHRLTKRRLKFLRQDPLFKEECDRVNDAINEAMAAAKARAVLLASGPALDHLEDILGEKPYNPITGEGDVFYDKKLKTRVALEIIKAVGVDNASGKHQGKLVVVITDAKEPEEKADLAVSMKDTPVEIEFKPDAKPTE